MKEELLELQTDINLPLSRESSKFIVLFRRKDVPQRERFINFY